MAQHCGTETEGEWVAADTAAEDEQAFICALHRLFPGAAGRTRGSQPPLILFNR